MAIDSTIGRKLKNRYEILEMLGQGSMGRVYGGRDIILGGAPVAIKFLAQTLLNSKMQERFEQEAKTCALLGGRSIHIIRVMDYGSEDGVPFYVMEYLKGKSLSETLLQKPLSMPRFLNLTLQICRGLECAHQGILVNGQICPIIHRDIKPGNILITPDQTLGELAKILDFGIAKTLQIDGGQTNCFMGTLAYSSPEQMEGCELDSRSDIYSLGVMMFQMLTGRMPLQADTHTFPGWYKAHHVQTPRSFKEANSTIKIPKVIEALVMSCLEKSPNNRPQSTTEMIKTLEPLKKRYEPGRKIHDSIRETLRRVPVRDRTPEDVCRLESWPESKPIAEIVFPQVISIPERRESLATLWMMLPRYDIDNLADCIPYNKFLFIPSPHPVMLWVTVLYTRRFGPRWLRCYLDLKTQLGKQMTHILGETKQYRVLFFAMEDPNYCTKVMTLNIAEPSGGVNPNLIEKQSKLLKDFESLGYTAPSTQPTFSKSLLNAEFEKIKPTILENLEQWVGS